MKEANRAQAGSLCHQGFRIFEPSLLLKIPKIISIINGMMIFDNIDNLKKHFGSTGFQPVHSFQSPGKADRAGHKLDLIVKNGCEIYHIT
jgi:hypothetical protein